MSWRNCSLVTGDLFLGLELIMYGKVEPSVVNILNLNEIVELVVLKEKLLMPSSDHITIMHKINNQKIKDLGGVGAIDWKYEIKNLGKAHLDKPVITNTLFDNGVLVLDTEQKKDKEFRDFGDNLYSKQWQGKWLSKSIGLDWGEEKEIIEVDYVRYMNNFLQHSSDPLYLKMLILALPDLLSSQPDMIKSKYDASWMYKFYREVEIYSKFAKRKSLGFTDTVLMHPFVALNFQHSEQFIDILYKRLKEVRSQQILDFLELEQAWIYDLPPLTTILLHRCRKLEDIPGELLKIRDEFKNLRDSLTKYQKSYEEAVTIKDKLELKREFQNSIDIFMRKVTGGKRRIMKTIIDFAIGQSDSMIQHDFIGPSKTVLGKLAEYLYDRRLYPWMNSYLHMYDESVSIKSDSNLYRKIFGDVKLDHFNELEIFAQNSNKLLNIHDKKTKRR